MTEIQKDLRLSESAVGLLVTASVLVFAGVSPVAVLIIRRAGAELSMALTSRGVLAGELLRAVPNAVGMVAGTVIIGISIAVGDVVLPMVIHRDVPPALAALMTGAYTATLNIGSVLTALCIAPVAAVLGRPLAGGR